MTGPATQLQQGLQQFANFLPSYEAMTALEETLDDGAISVEGIVAGRSDIVFSGVSYRHPGGRVGVSDVTLAIAAGSLIGITGASGSGKSSFADLLVGLHAPQAGAIVVGGQPLTDTTRQAWRSVDATLKDVLVVLVAPKPGGGQVIVGWYPNATLLRVPVPQAFAQMALCLMLNVCGGDAAATCPFETCENVSEHGVFELSRFDLIARLERALDSPLVEYFLQIGRNWDADIPAVTAAALATTAFQIGIVCQRDGTHKWHPL